MEKPKKIKTKKTKKGSQVNQNFKQEQLNNKLKEKEAKKTKHQQNNAKIEEQVQLK